MTDFSWNKADKDGKDQAQQGLPNCAPQKHNEPFDSYATRQNSFDHAKKEQEERKKSGYRDKP